VIRRREFITLLGGAMSSGQNRPQGQGFRDVEK
jgi:hypothetical protein